MDAFFQIHSGLQREGPGNDECTQRALELAGPLPEEARVLDLGCGPGGQTRQLLRGLPRAQILAVDRHRPFLDDLRRLAQGNPRLETLEADLRELVFGDASFDLIWCEGAAYLMGVPAALAAWKSWLRPGGRLAFSEAVWLRTDPPARVRACWQEYAAMTDVPGVLTWAEAAGYRVLGQFILPEEAWWHYYGPLEARLEGLHANTPELRLAVQATRDEIETYRAYSEYYGYLFLVLAAGG